MEVVNLGDMNERYACLYATSIFKIAIRDTPSWISLSGINGPPLNENLK